MVTKKVAIAAMENEQSPSMVFEEIDYSNQQIEPPSTVPAQTYIVFRLVNKKVKRLTLDGICHNVKNPKTGQYETIRLIRGASSIWTSELTELLKDKDYVSKNRIGIQFLDGICRIPSNRKTELDYAKFHLSNVGKNRGIPGKYNFYEYDAAEEQKMRFDKQMTRIHLIQQIGSMQEDKMVKLALFLGIKPNDEEVGTPKTPDGFRSELLIKADSQPDIVAKYMDAKEVEVSYMVRKGIIDAKIDLGGQTRNVIWAGNAGFICKLPEGRKAIEYLTEFAMTNSNEGRQFKEQLETMT